MSQTTHPVEIEAMETDAISESERKLLRSLTRHYILARFLAQIKLPHCVSSLLKAHWQRNYPVLFTMPIGYATTFSPPASTPRNRSGTISGHWLCSLIKKRWKLEIGNDKRKKTRRLLLHSRNSPNEYIKELLASSAFSFLLFSFFSRRLILLQGNCPSKWR